jgi:acetylornithine deacetylase/succinyl-diaminopimelate desuccinylase-like protein
MYQVYIALLKEFINFKSISTDSQFKQDINLTAKWLKDLFEKSGFISEIIDGYGNPIVLSEYRVDESLPTCLIYGHYDVQPASKEDGWDSDPFEVKESEDRLYARGIVDNKGQILIHIATILDLISRKELKYNIKFIIEGNEETGSPDLEKFIKDYSSKLKSDFVLISDSEISGDSPTVEGGFRGMFNCTVKVKTSDKDVHSGIFGGTIPNAIHELCKIIDKLHDEKNKITIEHIYKNAEEVSLEILENNKNIAFDPVKYMALSGVKKLFNEYGEDYYTQSALRPAVEVTGIMGGYIQEGYKNGIHGSASAKINVRLAPNQKPYEMFEIFKNYIQKIAPDYTEVTIEPDAFSDGVMLDLSNEFAQKSIKVLEEVFQKKVVKKFSGGSLPIVSYLNKILNTPSILVGLGNEDCNMHGANENYNIDLLKKGLEFSEKFFSLKLEV